jgi:hypothetical protein
MTPGKRCGMSAAHFTANADSSAKRAYVLEMLSSGRIHYGPCSQLCDGRRAGALQEDDGHAVLHPDG